MYENTEKIIRIQSKDDEVMSVCISRFEDTTEASLELINCTVDICGNKSIGEHDDVILNITWVPDIDSIYHLRDFLNNELPDRTET